MNTYCSAIYCQLSARRELQSYTDWQLSVNTHIHPITSSLLSVFVYHRHLFRLNCSNADHPPHVDRFSYTVQLLALYTTDEERLQKLTWNLLKVVIKLRAVSLMHYPTVPISICAVVSLRVVFLRLLIVLRRSNWSMEHFLTFAGTQCMPFVVDGGRWRTAEVDQSRTVFIYTVVDVRESHRQASISCYSGYFYVHSVSSHSECKMQLSLRLWLSASQPVARP